MARNIVLVILGGFLILFIAAVVYLLLGRSSINPGNNTASVSNNIAVAGPTMKHLITIDTNYGEIQFGTYDDDAPSTVQNFIDLTNKGFYNGLTFHRVVKDFVIQGGDPNCKPATVNPKTGGLELNVSGPCGAGGPGYKLNDELNPDTLSYQEGYVQGVVAMANSGPNTNGSQFFIMLKDNLTLPHNYTIFGKVVKGQDVVQKIGEVQVDPKDDRPVSVVIMKKVTVAPYSQ